MLSIQTRQILAGFILPILIVISIGIIFVGHVWPSAISYVRLSVMEKMAPAYAVMVYPQKQVQGWVADLKGVTNLASENRRLRQENHDLQMQIELAKKIETENARLKTLLHWGTDLKISYVAGQVIRDETGPYLHAVLLDVGNQHNLHTGSIAVDALGLVGRVSEVGPHIVRVLLITDSASRIPVTMISSQSDAIMTGDNSSLPRLLYYSPDHRPVEGEQVETHSQQGLLGGVVVGHVHYNSSGRPVVVPVADLAHLSIVRVFDEGEPSDAPPAEGRVRERVPIEPLAPQTEPSGWQGLEKFWPFSHVGNG
ncbi:rod shape-determining protein MreC [Acetobacteraceae bacterium ESL0709]|nr:rod shape-determining protein MreC [Acetobacteraceae bacterium ESL0697]MDF7677663.1 rod shape-determining protein MreC [Acetobacteraceae bacterium ESL0709]